MKMKYGEYLRNVINLTEEQIDNRMKNIEFYGVHGYEGYTKYCKENEFEHESYEDVFWSDRW